MHILCTNDDGILSPGLQVLASACRTVADVTVVAPDREQSAQSHALTLTRPLRPVRRPDGTWQVDGTPTDCVLLAVDVPLVPVRPDFVFSGINHGPNLGEDVLYSGTVSAAMEALMIGVPGVAISFAGRRDDLIEGYADIVAELVRRIVTFDDLPAGTLLSINLPGIPADEVQGIRVAKLGSRVFHNSVMANRDPWGRDVYWIGGGQITWAAESDSDYTAVQNGFVAITPLRIDLTAHERLDQYDSLARVLEA